MDRGNIFEIRIRNVQIDHYHSILLLTIFLSLATLQYAASQMHGLDATV